MEHGGGDSTLTIDYIQRLLTRTMAANSIVESLNRRDHNVRFVVEGPEYGESINTLSKNKLINKNIFKHPNKISMNSLFEIQKLIDDLVPEILPNITGYNMSSFVVGSSIGSLMYLDIDLINEIEKIEHSLIELTEMLLQGDLIHGIACYSRLLHHINQLHGV